MPRARRVAPTKVKPLKASIIGYVGLEFLWENNFGIGKNVCIAFGYNDLLYYLVIVFFNKCNSFSIRNIIDQ